MSHTTRRINAKARAEHDFNVFMLRLEDKHSLTAAEVKSLLAEYLWSICTYEVKRERERKDRSK